MQDHRSEEDPNRDLLDEYLSEEYQDLGPCERFSEGQEFVLEGYGEMATVPEGFCAWAWADIRKDIWALAMGANIPGMRQPGTVISGCTNWLRPVIFKIERLGEG